MSYFLCYGKDKEADGSAEAKVKEGLRINAPLPNNRWTWSALYGQNRGLIINIPKNFPYLHLH